MKVIPLDSLPSDTRAAIQRGVARTLCPVCQGGTHKEQSLSIRDLEEGIIKLSCWRASCGFYAVSFIDPAARLQSNKLKEGKPYDAATSPIGKDMAAFLAVEYGLTHAATNEHGWRWSDDGLVMPVKSPTGEVRGHITRTFEEPKRCMTYKETAQPWLDWWLGPRDCVIVEDTLSACRLNQLGYTACALLGTNISVDDAKEIAYVASSGEAFLALDRDAFLKSLKFAARHRHIIKLKPVCLDEDIKNMSDDSDIEKLFGDEDGRRDAAGSSDIQVEESV